MHKIEFEGGGRSMRWYEWLAGLVLLGAAAGVRAAPIYKCVDAEQHITYQQESCGAQQTQRAIDIAPAPRPAPPPKYYVERSHEQPGRGDRPVRERASREVAYECRTSDGRLFYRLGPCPHSVPGGPSSSGGAHRGKSARGSGGSTSVATRRVPREEACREIQRAGAIGRDGHEFDEHVSTYERNLGHDPCKS